MLKDAQNIIPQRQALGDVVHKAIIAYDFLHELDQELKEIKLTRSLSLDDKGKIASIAGRQKIVKDIFAVYIKSLVDTRRGNHSLLNSYKSNECIKNFQGHPIVKKCCMYRENRIGHISKKYGLTISIKEIISSDIKTYLSDIETGIHLARRS